MSETHAPVTEEHRKLFRNLLSHVGCSADTNANSVWIDVKDAQQVLADALAKEAERVRRETLEEAAKIAARWTSYLAVHGSNVFPEGEIRALAEKAGKP